ncbi:MAG: DUF4118 domain-containing protein [Planctomycetia bacterium]|nr:DUF4118 domain-containing protein [Planctomycetia bacterium]
MANEHSQRPAQNISTEGAILRPIRSFLMNSWKRYVATIAVLATCGLLCWVSHSQGLTDANIVMIFLAGVVLVAACFGRGPAIMMAISSVLVFDFFFVHPSFAFTPTETQYFITLAVMLGVGLLISELTARIQTQLETAKHQERRAAQLYQMTRKLSTITNAQELLPAAGELLAEVVAGRVVLYTCEKDDSLTMRFESTTTSANRLAVAAAAQWVAGNHRTAGAGTCNLTEVPAIVLPMIVSQRVVGVLSVESTDPLRCLDPEELRMLETCSNLIATSIERTQAALEAQEAHLQVEREHLRNSLLSAVSHDLRTPLALMEVTASSLLENSADQNGASRQEMLESMVDASRRLARQVDNLLDMSRLDSGNLNLNQDWQVLEELVGVVTTRFRRELQGRPLRIQIPENFPLLWVASDLLEHMLANLLENAIRYTPPDTLIEIQAEHRGALVQIRIADQGPGLPPGSEVKVFEKFYRGRSLVADGQRGVGLGLTICQAIARAHGGTIRAANLPTGGAEFVVELPFSQGASAIQWNDAALQPDA